MEADYIKIPFLPWQQKPGKNAKPLVRWYCLVVQSDVGLSPDSPYDDVWWRKITKRIPLAIKIGLGAMLTVKAYKVLTNSGIFGPSHIDQQVIIDNEPTVIHRPNHQAQTKTDKNSAITRPERFSGSIRASAFSVFLFGSKTKTGSSFNQDPYLTLDLSSLVPPGFIAIAKPGINVIFTDIKVQNFLEKGFKLDIG